jgi:hypothetical protein
MMKKLKSAHSTKELKQGHRKLSGGSSPAEALDEKREKESPKMHKKEGIFGEEAETHGNKSYRKVK